MTNKGSDHSEMIVTTKQISEIFGVSARRINQLEKEGYIVKVAHGKFDLAKSVQAYIEHLRQQQEQVQTEEGLDLYTEKTLLTKANREYRELELKILRAELHRSEDVAEVMNKMLANFKARIRTIPSKVSPKLIGETELAIIVDQLKSEIDETLLELSEYDPAMFHEASVASLEEDEGDEENE